MTYLIGITHKEMFAGLIGFSGILSPYLFKLLQKGDDEFGNAEEFRLPEKAKQLPIFAYHGK